jgi:transcriptional regulator with XRE-family HTH domain
MDNTTAPPSRADSSAFPPRPTDGQPSAPPKVNRLPDYLAQIEDYWFRGPKRRFAKDAGISESTFSRIFHGVTNPRYRDVCRIVALLEQKLGKKIDPRDIYEL